MRPVIGPPGPVLAFSPQVWRRFAELVKAGA
jgi:hypothetical protein